MRAFLVSKLSSTFDVDIIDERIRKLRKDAFGTFLIDFHFLEAYIQDSIFHIPNYVLLPEHEKFRGDALVSAVDEKCMTEQVEHLIKANKKTLFMNEMLRNELKEIEILHKFYDSILERIDHLEERLKNEGRRLSMSLFVRLGKAYKASFILVFFGGTERNAFDTTLSNEKKIFVRFGWRLLSAERFKLLAIGSVPFRRKRQNPGKFGKTTQKMLEMTQKICKSQEIAFGEPLNILPLNSTTTDSVNRWYSMMNNEDSVSPDDQNFTASAPKIRKLDTLSIDNSNNPASLLQTVQKGHKSSTLSTVGEKTSFAVEHVPNSCPEERKESILSIKVSKDCPENKNYVTATEGESTTFIDREKFNSVAKKEHVVPLHIDHTKRASDGSTFNQTDGDSSKLNVDLAENGKPNQSSLKDVSSMNILPFCNLLGKLKHLPRTGWLKYKLNQHPEPVAGHMYRMAILAFCLDDHMTSCNGNSKQVGDITPYCGISPEEKYRRENEAMQKISTLVPGKIGAEMYDLWREYESQSSPEANLVKQLDKFDLIAQAYEYELENQKPKYLQEFFNSTSKSIKDEPILSWSKFLLEEREKWSEEKSDVGSSSTSDDKN
uniref:HD domain-containing protein n=1 Tax=Romanomermis culicivorax TaxID=13658 RepID=A0A915KMG6_ROMCU